MDKFGNKNQSNRTVLQIFWVLAFHFSPLPPSWPSDPIICSGRRRHSLSVASLLDHHDQCPCYHDWCCSLCTGLNSVKLFSHNTEWKYPWHISCFSINSLLPVSRYIDMAFADKGSHQKKNLQPKCPDTSKFGLLGKPTKKLELNPLFQSIFETSKFQKLKKSCFFLFWKNIFLTPPPLNCLYLRPSISVFTNFFFAESVMDSSIILK